MSQDYYTGRIRASSELKLGYNEPGFLNGVPNDKFYKKTIKAEIYKSDKVPTPLQVSIYRSYCQMDLNRNILYTNNLNLVAMRYVLACMHVDIRSFSGYIFRISDFRRVSRNVLSGNIEKFKEHFLSLDKVETNLTFIDIQECLKFLIDNEYIQEISEGFSGEYIPDRHKITKDLFNHTVEES